MNKKATIRILQEHETIHLAGWYIMPKPRITNHDKFLIGEHMNTIVKDGSLTQLDAVNAARYNDVEVRIIEL